VNCLFVDLVNRPPAGETGNKVNELRGKSKGFFLIGFDFYIYHLTN